MNSAPKLQELVLGWYASFSAGDISITERLLSHHPDLLVIGTDPAEWVKGYETIFSSFKAQVQEMSGFQIEAGDLIAHHEGSVGWVTDRPRVKLPDGKAIPMRNTLIFRQEAGEWKLIHQHISVGVPNEELVGKALPI